MELTYKQLKKRDVINIVDGRSFGHITDLKLKFPQGVLTGIFVAGKKSKGIFKIFDKSALFIEESKIVKIGGDVILVNLRRGDVCSPDETPHIPDDRPKPPPKPVCPPFFPICPPLCPPPDDSCNYHQNECSSGNVCGSHHDHHGQQNGGHYGSSHGNTGGGCAGYGRIDLSDY